MLSDSQADLLSSISTHLVMPEGPASTFATGIIGASSSVSKQNNDGSLAFF